MRSEREDVQTLSVEKADDNIQNNGEQNGKHTGSYDGKVERSTPSFDTNISGQSPKGNPELRGEINSPAHQDQHDPADH